MIDFWVGIIIGAISGATLGIIIICLFVGDKVKALEHQVDVLRDDRNTRLMHGYMSKITLE